MKAARNRTIDLGIEEGACYLARCLTVDAAWRNEHNTPWLSMEAAEYVETLGDGAEVEKERANALDEDFMAQVLSFFDAALQPQG